MADSYGKEQSIETRVFLAALIDLSREHGIVLSHEAGGGAFVVSPRKGQDPQIITRRERWLLGATEEDRP